MHPEYIHLGNLSVDPMTLALGIGVILSVLLAGFLLKGIGVSFNYCIVLFALGSAAAYFGAKGAYALLHPESVERGRIGFFLQGLSGSSVIGALPLVLLSTILLLHRRSLILEGLDRLAPALLVLVAWGRIGCLADGCCFGKPSKAPLWMVFDSRSPAGKAFPLTPLYPTQLVEAINAAIAAAFCLLLLQKKVPAGTVFASSLLLYGADRLLVDFLRFYPGTDLLGTFHGYAVPKSQPFALAIVFSGILLLVWAIKRGANFAGALRPNQEAQG
jgi:phosphatidylglycerol:prolipoprotein diacylglycerol transferase